MKVKQILAGILVALLALSTAACGSGTATQSQETSSPTTASETAAPTTGATSEAATTQAAAPVTVQFWHGLSGGPETELKSLTDKFNSTNGKSITVKLVNQGAYGDLQKKLMASIAAKTLPDVAQVYNNWINESLSSVVPLDDFVAKDFDNYNDIVESYRNEGAELGKIYTLAFNKSSQVLFYNKDEFKKLGINPPATWEELAADAKKIKGDTGKPALGYDDLVAMFQQYMLQNGSEFISDGQVKFTGPDGVAAYKFISELYLNGYARLAGEDKYMSGPFGNQNVYMYVGSSAGASYIKANGFELGAAPLPKGKKGAVPQAGTNIAMFTQEPANQAAAWEYLKFLTQADNTAEWAMKTGYLPVRTSAFQSQTYQDFMAKDEVAKAAFAQVGDQYFESAFKGSNEVRTLLGTEVESAILKKVAADKAVADIGKKVQAVLDKNK